MKITTRKYYNYDVYTQNVDILSFRLGLDDNLSEQIADVIDYYMDILKTTDCYISLENNGILFENGLDQATVKIIETFLIAYHVDNFNAQDLFLKLRRNY